MVQTYILKSFNHGSILLLLFLCCCNSTSKLAFLSLHDVKFITAPYVSNHNGNYALKYQADSTGIEGACRIGIGTTVRNGKGCFYIIGRTSFPEPRHLVTIPITPQDRLYIYALTDSIWWLNKGGSMERIPVVKE